MSSTAWVLGTAPCLELNRLSELESEFTVGINHILRSGFRPDIIFFIDRINEREPHLWAPLVESGVTLVGPGGHCRVEDQPGWGKHPDFKNRHSSGDTAVRWLLFIGFERVVCLGMGSGTTSSKTNFYGNGPRGARERVYVRAKQDLLASFPDRVFFPEPGECWDRFRRQP